MTKFRFNILIATVFYLLIFLFPKISESAVVLTVTKSIPIISPATVPVTVVMRNSTEKANYTITVTNTGSTTAAGVQITDTPDTTNINFLSNTAPVLSGGASRTATVNPATNASPMTWGTFSIPSGGSVSITVTMNVLLATTLGVHNNSASVTTTTALGGGSITNFNGSSSSSDDITVVSSRTISGKVFLDSNHNGVLDVGESGIGGVSVTMYKLSIGCTTVTTDASGNYTFTPTVFSSSTSDYYYIIENGNASATCPPLASAQSGMGGSSTLKVLTLFSANNTVITKNFGSYPLIAQNSFADACPVDGYISEGLPNSTLSAVNLTNNLKYPLGSAAGFEYNALAFNTSDKFLYAITSGFQPQITSELVRVDSSGIALSLGEVSGLPTTSSAYGTGDYNYFNDRFYVQALQLDATSGSILGGANTIYAINIATKSVDVTKNIPFSSAQRTADFAFNPTPASDGINYLYAMPQVSNSNTIFKINPNTGALTTLTISGLPSSIYIASFFDPENNLYVEDNATSYLYKIKLNVNQDVATLGGSITTTIASGISRADGARCPFAKLPYSFTFTTDNRKSVVPGAIITYPHRLISGTDGTVSLSITNAQGWPFTVFEDVNGNNILDAGDLAVTNFSNIGNVFAKANSEMNLLIRVQIPLNAAPNVTDTMKISATLNPTSLTLDPITIMNIDQTTVTNQATGELQLIKTAKTYLPDGTTLYDATGRTAKPNYYIDYFIDYKNISNGTLNNIKITDFVPAYTTLISSGFTAPATGTITQLTPIGNTKTITWNVNGTLPQTQGGQVVFRVKLN